MATYSITKEDSKYLILTDGVITHQVVDGETTTINDCLEFNLVLEQYPTRKTVGSIGWYSRNKLTNERILSNSIKKIENA